MSEEYKIEIICKRVVNKDNEREPNEYTIKENDKILFVTRNFIEAQQAFINRLQ